MTRATLSTPVVWRIEGADVPAQVRLTVLILFFLAFSSVSVVSATNTTTGPAKDAPTHDIVEIFSHFEDRSNAMVYRFATFMFVAGAIGLAIWLGHRAWLIRNGLRPQKPAKVRPGFRRMVKATGLEPAEFAFLKRLAKPIDEPPERLLLDRNLFEHAVESGREIIHQDNASEGHLASIRSKLGWTGSPSQDPKPMAQPERPIKLDTQVIDLNQEVEFFGTGSAAGFCNRGVLVHRDSRHLVFRLHERLDAMPWQAGDVLQLYFWRSNDAGYLLQCKLIEFRDQGPGFLILGGPQRVDRQQKRIYVRVPYVVPVSFLHIPLAEASASIGTPRSGGLFEGRTEDLSAGGFRLSCEQELAEGDYLSLSGFEPCPDFELLVRVVSLLPEGKNGLRHYGVQFIGMPAPERDRVVQLVFRLQRDSLQEAHTQARMQEHALESASAMSIDHSEPASSAVAPPAEAVVKQEKPVEIEPESEEFGAIVIDQDSPQPLEAAVAAIEEQKIEAAVIEQEPELDEGITENLEEAESTPAESAEDTLSAESEDQQVEEVPAVEQEAAKVEQSESVEDPAETEIESTEATKAVNEEAESSAAFDADSIQLEVEQHVAEEDGELDK